MREGHHIVMVFCCTDHAVAAGRIKLAKPLVPAEGFSISVRQLMRPEYRISVMQRCVLRFIEQGGAHRYDRRVANPEHTLQSDLSNDADRPKDDKHGEWNSQQPENKCLSHNASPL